MLTENLTPAFTTGARNKGRDYFFQRRVEMLRWTDDGKVRAVVSGEDGDYIVLMEFHRTPDAWSIRADCDCNYATSYGDPCKHVYAALMAVDARKPFGLPPEKVSLEMALEPLDDWGALDDDPLEAIDDLVERSSDDDDEPAFEWDLDKRRPHPFSGRTATPRWQTVLGEVAQRRYLIDDEDPNARPDLSRIEPLYILEFQEHYHEMRFLLALGQRTTTLKGTPGKIKDLRLSQHDIPRLSNELDRHICLMLLGCSVPGNPYDRYSSFYRSESRCLHRCIMDPRAISAVLPLLFRTGRVFVRACEGGEARPLTWDDGPPWDLVLSLEPVRGSQEYAFTLRIRRGDTLADFRDGDRIMAGHPEHLISQGVMSPIRTHGCMSWLGHHQKIDAVRVTLTDREALLKRLAEMGVHPPVEWPAEWRVQDARDLPPVPELRLIMDERYRSAKQQFVYADLAFRYGDLAIPAERSGSILIDPAGGRQVYRQSDVERTHVERLFELGCDRPSHSRQYRFRQNRLVGLVASLLDEGWNVLGDNLKFRKPGDLALQVSSGIDWFELNGAIDFEGQRMTLPALLAAHVKGERFIRLNDGSMGMLPQEWLDKHGALLGLGKVEKGGICFAKGQVSLIDALLAELPEAKFDETLAAARDKLNAFAGIASTPAPASFTGQLRSYQEHGLAWMSFLNDIGWGGCLADDMGLGKTIQVLALLAERKSRGDALPSLAVVPKSVVFNWVREAERFAPDLRVMEYLGSGRKDQADRFAQHDLIVTTYGTLRKDIEKLREREFNYVILDEAQAIKNPQSLAAKCSRLLKARHRLVMTGTPVENHLSDLWSLFEFLNPGLLGGSVAFREVFCRKPADDEPDRRYSLLHRMLRPFILRRTKEQVAPELPERVEQTVECVMGTKQKQYYQELKEYYRASLLGRVDHDGLAKSKIHVLEALLRLRQAACHPGLIDPARHDAEATKLDTLLEMLDESMSDGHKTLVFSQFTSLLAILRQKLDAAQVSYEYLDGQTTDRRDRVDRFQNDPTCRLFLISLKAGGVGLNLTAADYVFILDPWWNPAVEAQAIDRTHRIGQEKKVIAYRLITRDTVESRILELQQRKRDLAGAIITEANSLIQDLTRDDLSLLLS